MFRDAFSAWSVTCTLSSNKSHCLSLDIRSSALDLVRPRSLIRSLTSFWLGKYGLLQRRQSVLRSWRVVNLVQQISGSNRKNSDFPDKFLIFQAKISDDLFFSPQLKKFLFFFHSFCAKFAILFPKPVHDPPSSKPGGRDPKPWGLTPLMISTVIIAIPVRLSDANTGYLLTYLLIIIVFQLFQLQI